MTEQMRAMNIGEGAARAPLETEKGQNRGAWQGSCRPLAADPVRPSLDF